MKWCAILFLFLGPLSVFEQSIRVVSKRVEILE